MFGAVAPLHKEGLPVGVKCGFSGAPENADVFVQIFTYETVIRNGQSFMVEETDSEDEPALEVMIWRVKGEPDKYHVACGAEMFGAFTRDELTGALRVLVNERVYKALGLFALTPFMPDWPAIAAALAGADSEAPQDAR
jgi:hypothetical protein